MTIIKRRKTTTVQIGNVLLGCKNPIVIQAMTNTPTANVEKTVSQIKELADTGAEMVRITINDEAAVKAVPDIIKNLQKDGYNLPIIGDFHYNGHILLTKNPEAAQMLSKYRINPGNTGKDDNFDTFIKLAKKYQKPIRIGINWGSIDKKILTDLHEINEKKKKPLSIKEICYEAMVQSALGSAKKAEELGLAKDKIVLSVKISDVQDLIAVNRMLAQKCDYVLHVGLTEAGSFMQGITSSAAALGILLQEGIGDTIRISLTPGPGRPRSDEVRVAQALLQGMGFRQFRPKVTSCPGCGRTDSEFFITLAAETEKFIEANLTEWKKKYPGVEQLHIAVMGCVVNGPGESKDADIGISLPGKDEISIAPVYIDGKLYCRLKGKDIFGQFKKVLVEFIKRKYSDLP
jgi:(E)-4-hydroxy-3-methylbut-2-enyl-diphosphate synthase